MGLSKSNAKGKFHSNTSLPQEARETSNRQTEFTPTTTGKRRIKKASKLVEEIIKILGEVNEKQRKETKI